MVTHKHVPNIRRVEEWRLTSMYVPNSRHW